MAETSPVTLQLLFSHREAPGRVWLGGPNRHPNAAEFTVTEPIALTGTGAPPAGAVLIWSDTVWINSKQILRTEVGDPIKLSPEVIEQLRGLGYLTQ